MRNAIRIEPESSRSARLRNQCSVEPREAKAPQLRDEEGFDDCLEQVRIRVPRGVLVVGRRHRDVAVGDSVER
jgi:hypothetical protein